MYAIAFDLHQDTLSQTYGSPSYTNAYMDIKTVLNGFGFERQQGSVYFGSEKVDAVTCVLAVQHLSKSFPWFAVSVKDIRMLRVEDNNDLRPAINAVSYNQPLI